MKIEIFKLTVYIMILCFSFNSFAESTKLTSCTKWNGIVDQNIKLTKNCTYLGQVKVSKSNVVLDCNGGKIDGGHDRTKTLDGIISGLLYKKLKNVTVKNCTVQNFFGRGINFRYLGASYLDSTYLNSPENIIIQDSVIWHNFLSGIYINSFSQKIIIKNTKIAYNGGVGIYLERESRYNQIKDNSIYKNSGESLNTIIKASVIYL